MTSQGHTLELEALLCIARMYQAGTLSHSQRSAVKEALFGEDPKLINILANKNAAHMEAAIEDFARATSSPEGEFKSLRINVDLQAPTSLDDASSPLDNQMMMRKKQVEKKIEGL